MSAVGKGAQLNVGKDTNIFDSDKIGRGMGGEREGIRIN